MLGRSVKRFAAFRRVGGWIAANKSAAAYLADIAAAQAHQLRLAVLAQPRHQDPRSLARFEVQVFSQTGMDGLLAEVFRRIGVKARTFVEIGTESGVETNTTFLLSQGWTGHWVEGGPHHVASIRRTFSEPISDGRLRVAEQMVTAENVTATLDQLGVPQEPDLFSLDIDRNTYWVLKAVMLRPRVVVVEYNANIPPSVEWAVEYSPTKSWNGTAHFGAGLKNYELWGRHTGYRLVGCDLAGYNAVFVRDDLAGSLFPDPATAEHLYEPVRIPLGHRYSHVPCFTD